MLPLRTCFALAVALRRPMRRAGARANPDPALGQREDAWEYAEADYRRVQGIRSRPPSASKFTIHDPGCRPGDKCECPEYLWDSTWPILKRALELDREEPDRSPAAQALAAVLHYQELHTHHVLAARGKLEAIYQQLRPIDQPDPVHLSAPSRVTGRAERAA
jgi:hypothetical protein